MSSLPGGAASKLGDRYEGWWTLLRLADVLKGDATALRIEPPAAEGSGIEFWISQGGVRWCEQVKDVQYTWTLHRLKAEGVLPSVVGHLADGHHIRFVASTPALDLEALATRARIAESLGEYRKILTSTQLPEFERLATTWCIDEDAAWKYLQRICVEHQPPEHLRRLVHLTYELLLQGDPEVNVNELRSWLDELLHQTLTAPMLWDRLGEKGYARRLLAGEPGTVQALSATVERHRRRVEAMRPANGLVPQPHVARVIERLTASDGARVLLVDGRAGMGKSTVAAEALRQLGSSGWYAATIRMDAVGADSQTAAGIGRAFDLTGSPAVLLAGISAGSPAVLLVDQLDAVSTYSGRMADSYEAVSELLDQTASLPNLKVVLVVRTADLTGDPRIRSLADDPSVERLTIGELSSSDVAAALQANGIDSTGLSESTLRLLRTPLHFAVFSRLAPESRASSHRTLPDLYEALTTQIRRDIEQQIGSLDWSHITETLIRYMSDNERLDAPAVVINSASQRQIGALYSHGVLALERNRVSFFHETYFDFLFATAFVSANRDLHDYLADSGQHLFRRAPARQVLEYLAANHRDAFRESTVRILTSDRVRRHLQDVAILVLRQLDASAEDWLTVEPIAFSPSHHASRLAALLSSPRWFDAADAAGRWEGLLADPATVDIAAHQLVIAARDRPDRAVALLRPYLGSSEAWRLRFRALVEWSLRPGLADLAVELVERGDLDDVRGPLAVNSDCWSILYGLKSEDPAAAARLIGAYLRRGLARALPDGSADPFASGHLNPYSSGGATTIREVASSAPAEFVDQVLPFIVSIISVDNHETPPDGRRTRSRWAVRYTGRNGGIDDAVFDGLEEALRQLATIRPQETIERIQPLLASNAGELRFLACRAFAATESGNEAIDWLLSDERNFRLGWADSPRWASRELIESAARDCDDEHLQMLADRLLDHYPAWEKTVDGRRLRGRAQYDLLSAIDPSRRNREVARRVGELERKFENSPPSAPQPIEAHFVPPPIPTTVADRLSDDHWISAIRRYQSGETSWSGDRPVGGANELADLLGSRAKAEPERFARLALTFAGDTPGVYFERVIDAVAGGVPLELLGELCRRARDIAGQDVGRSICYAIEKVVGGAGADEAFVQLLEECAYDADPDREWASTPAGSGESYFGGDFLSAGLNSTRGAAARAIASLLFAGSEHAVRLTPTVARLATDPVLAVRVMATDAIGALMNHQREAALSIADDLFSEAPLVLFEATTTARLLTYALLREPDTFAPHLVRALAADESIAERAGSIWASAFVHDLLASPLPDDTAALSPAARRGAAAAFAADPSAAPEQLFRLLNDEVVGVREAAAAALRRLNDLDMPVAETLVATFVDSAAYDAHFENLFIALDDSSRVLPAACLRACERAVELAGGELGDIRTSRAAMSDHIINVVLRLYRQGDRVTRQRCLDVIDGLSAAGAYGLERALADER